MQSSFKELRTNPSLQVHVYDPGGVNPSHTPCCLQRSPIGPSHSSMSVTHQHSAQFALHSVRHFSSTAFSVTLHMSLAFNLNLFYLKIAKL